MWRLIKIIIGIALSVKEEYDMVRLLLESL